MPLPALLLGFVASTLYGAIFHVWHGGGIGRLLFYLILGWTGFWIGQYIADRFSLSIIKLGALHFGSASLASWGALLLGWWLSLVDRSEKKTPPR